MKLISGLVAFSLFIKGAIGQCSLCPGGYSAIEDPTYKIHSLAPSCEEVDAGLAGVEDKDCDNELALVNFEFDFSTACCSDISLQSIACSICPEDLYLHPDVLLPNTTIPITCGEVEIIASFVSDGDSFTCKQIKAIGKAECCGDKIEECTLCPAESFMEAGANIIPGSSKSCKDYEKELNEAEDCAAAKDELAGVNYNIQTFCGCTGIGPSNTCEFCENSLLNEFTEVPGSGGAVCGDFRLLAPSIEGNACSLYIETCCSSSPTAPNPAPTPTDSPEPGPTNTGSGAAQMSSFLLFIAFVAILVVLEL